MGENEWTEEFPTQPGWYWFYGDPFGESFHRARLMVVDVVHAGKGVNRHIMAKGGGGFIYEDCAQGKWKKIENVPDIPEIDYE